MPKPKKSSKREKKVKISLKQKQTTKQSVIVNVKNVINERRRQAKPKSDMISLQPRSNFLANNLMSGNVSRYVQPAMAFAVNPPQFTPIQQQTAIVDKPLGKPVEPKQRPDVFDGVETDPYDIRQPKRSPDLPDESSSSSSSSGILRVAPRPPVIQFMPEEDIGPAQAFAGIPQRIDEVIGYRDSFKMPMMRGIGTLLIKILTNFLFNSSLNDIQSGMRVFKSKIYQRIKWTSTGSAHYFADAEITTKLIKQKIRFKEIR
jgi:hypothetical protein